MRKKYRVILVGIIFLFVILSGCGINPAVRQAQQRADGRRASASVSDVSISMEEAQNIALERVPGATERNISIELEKDDGWYIYEGDIEYNGMEYEFEIDADTGNILKWEEERW